MKQHKKEVYNSNFDLYAKSSNKQLFYETKIFRCIMAGLGLEGAAVYHIKSLFTLGEFSSASAAAFTAADGLALFKAVGKRTFGAVGLIWVIYEFSDCMDYF